MGLIRFLFGRKKERKENYKITEELPITSEEPTESAEYEESASIENACERTEEDILASQNQENTTKTNYDAESADKLNESGQSKKVKVKGYGGSFEIKKSKDGRFVFNLYASNKVIIATSQIYSSSQSAITGINSVIANAEKAAIEDQTLKTFTAQPFPKWEIYIDKAGQFRFRLLATNGSCVCHSQGYTQKSTCKKGIESVIRTVKSAEIDKAYLKKATKAEAK